MNTQIKLVAIAVTSSATGADAPKSRPSIYDESADGSKQIADALAVAKKDSKHVLVQFGANWCGWCHRLHKLFQTDKAIADELTSNYVVVMIDMNEGHNEAVDTKYGHPPHFSSAVYNSDAPSHCECVNPRDRHPENERLHQISNHGIIGESPQPHFKEGN